MKITDKIAEGVFEFGTKIGTADLPAFIIRVCTKLPSLSYGERFMLGNIPNRATNPKFPGQHGPTFKQALRAALA